MRLLRATVMHPAALHALLVRIATAQRSSLHLVCAYLAFIAQVELLCLRWFVLLATNVRTVAVPLWHALQATTKTLWVKVRARTVQRAPIVQDLRAPHIQRALLVHTVH